MIWDHEKKKTLLIRNADVYKLCVIMYIYVALSIIIVREASLLSEQIIAYIAGISLYLLPTIVGLTLINLVEQILGIAFNNILKLISSFSLGCIAIALPASILINSIVWKNSVYVLALLIITGLPLVKFFIHNHLSRNNAGHISKSRLFNSRLIMRVILISLALLGIYLLVYSTEHRFIPFPLINSQNTELWYSLHLYEGNSIPYSILSSYPRPTRLPLIILVGLVTYMYDIHPIYVYHTASKILPLVYIISSFLLAKHALKSTIAGLIATIFAPFSYLVIFRLNASGIVFATFPFLLLTFDILVEDKVLPKTQRENVIKYILILTIALFIPSMIILSTLFARWSFSPNIICMALAAVFLTLLALKDKEVKGIFLIGYSLGLFITWNHEYNAPFYISTILIMVLAKIYFNSISRRKLLTYFLFVIACFLFIFLQITGILKFPSNFMLSRYVFGEAYEGYWFDMDAKEKWFKLNNAYSTRIITLLLIIGIIALPFNKRLIPLSMALLWGLFLYFFPEGHFYRIYYISFPILTSTLIGYVISLLPLQIMNLSSETKIFVTINGRNRTSLRRHVGSIIILAIIIGASLYVIFAGSESPLSAKLDYVSDVRKYVNKEGHFSYITMDDVKCALWIFKNTPKIWVTVDYLTLKPLGYMFKTLQLEIYGEKYTKYIPLTNDTLLISDPYTMIVLAALSGRDIPIYQVGYPYLTEYPNISMERMNFIRTRILLANSSEEAYKSIQEIRDNHKPVYVIINGRVLAWIKHSERYFIYSNPVSVDVLKQHFSIFLDKKYFKLVWSTDKFLVFEVNLE